MSIEYHRVVKSYDKNNFQIFVFKYDRDQEANSLALIDLWLITRHDTHESKVRIDLDGLAEKVFHNPKEKMTDEQVDDLYDFFDTVIDDDVKVQRDIEKLELEVNDTIQDETKKLILAADMAMSAHPIDLSIDEIVKNLPNETKNNTRYKS